MSLLIDATSPSLRDYIQNRGEALQLLHHGYTYDSEFVRHIIGDTHGEIISSVRLRFSHCIKMQYGRCLQELKDLLLPWAYGLTGNISVDVLSLVNTNKILKDICGGQHGLVQQLIRHDHKNDRWFQ
jgi:hypothetical protein